jgi:hypothetical protein
LFFTRLQDRDITTKGFRPVWATTTERLLTFDALPRRWCSRDRWTRLTSSGEFRYVALTALNRAILEAFDEFGIQMMMPTYIADPREPKIVAAM